MAVGFWLWYVCCNKKLHDVIYTTMTALKKVLGFDFASEVAFVFIFSTERLLHMLSLTLLVKIFTYASSMHFILLYFFTHMCIPRHLYCYYFLHFFPLSLSRSHTRSVMIISHRERRRENRCSRLLFNACIISLSMCICLHSNAEQIEEASSTVAIYERSYEL
jgi:hypothetical protein